MEAVECSGFSSQSRDGWSDDVIQEAFREGTRLPDECESFLQTGVTTFLGWIERRFK